MILQESIGIDDQQEAFETCFSDVADLLLDGAGEFGQTAHVDYCEDRGGVWVLQEESFAAVGLRD